MQASSLSSSNSMIISLYGPKSCWKVLTLNRTGSPSGFGNCRCSWFLYVANSLAILFWLPLCGSHGSETGVGPSVM